MYLVQHRTTGDSFAMKRVSKAQMESTFGFERVRQERDIMEHNDSPFITKLHYAFQTHGFLYYIIDFAEGGELFHMLRRKGAFSEKSVQLYVAEVVLALEHLHNRGVLYSDLKLENLLIGADGHILLTDFGVSQTNKRNYFVGGTREYFAPEAIVGRDVTLAVDWWALVI